MSEEVGMRLFFFSHVAQVRKVFSSGRAGTPWPLPGLQVTSELVPDLGFR